MTKPLRRAAVSASGKPLFWITLYGTALAASVLAGLGMSRIWPSPAPAWHVLAAYLFSIASPVVPFVVEGLRRNARQSFLERPNEVLERSVFLLEHLLRDGNERPPIFIIATFLVPGLYETARSTELDDRLVQKCFGLLADAASRCRLHILYLEDHCVDRTVHADILERRKKFLLECEERAQKSEVVLQPATRDSFPAYDMLVLGRSGLIHLHDRQPGAEPGEWLFGYCFSSERAQALAQNMWSSVAARIPGVIDPGQLAAIRSIVGQIEDTRLRDVAVFNRHGFFDSAVRVYSELRADEGCFVVNESARPLPRVFRAFRETLGTVSILWIAPKDLATDPDREAFLGALIRDILCQRIRSARDRSHVRIIAVDPEPSLLKYVLTSRILICGSQVSRCSRVGLRIEDADWIAKFRRHWDGLAERSGRKEVREKCTEILRSYMDLQAQSGVHRVEYTELWAMIPRYVEKWRTQFELEGEEFVVNAEDLRASVRGVCSRNAQGRRR